MENTVIRSTLFVVALASAALAGSNSSAAPASANQPAPLASPHAAPMTPGGKATAPMNTGKVLQVKQGGGYTYAEVQTSAGKKTWIAGSQIDIKPGATVEWGDSMVMHDFNAKSLNRTFPEILFVNSWGPAGAAQVATAVHGTLPPPAAPAAAGTGGSGVVKSVVNSAGYTYIEVDRAGKTQWVATTETPMKAGDKVQWQGDTEMINFTAKSLARTFDKITFASSVTITH
jgi:hypothetical protein